MGERDERRGAGSVLAAWGVGLLLAGASACADDGASKGDDLDPDPQLPDHGDDPYAWGELDEGLPRPFEVEHLVASNGVVFVDVDALPEASTGEVPEGHRSGIYRLDEAALAWSFVTERPTKYGLASLVGGPDGELYAHRESSLWRLAGDEWRELAAPSEKISSLVVESQGGAGVVYGLRADDTIVEAYDIEADTWATHLDCSENAASVALPDKHPHDSATITSDGALHVSRKWAIRDTEGEVGAVFRCGRTVDDSSGAPAWTDETLNLRDTTEAGMPVHLLNATGNGWGPFGGIVRSPDGLDLYGNSEQGAFRLHADEARWEPVAAIWYGARVLVAGGSLCIGKERLYRYLDDYRRQLVGTYDRIDLGELRHVVSPDAMLVDEQLFVASFERVVKPEGGAKDDERRYATLVASRVRPDAPVQDRNLTLDVASYAGEAGRGEAVAEVRWAGASGDFFIAWNELDDAEEPAPVVGHLERRGEDGALRAEYISSGPIHDLVPFGDGIAFVGGEGLVVMDADLQSTRWRGLEGGARRVDADADRLVALSGKTVSVWTLDGERTGRVELGRNYIEDVAIHGDAGLVYAVGFDNQNNGAPVQVAYLVAHRLDGSDPLEFDYKVWGYDPKQLDDDMADTRLYRVHVGRDGALYVAGEVAGGNGIFRWNGQDLETPTLVTYDPYNTATNTASEHKGYVARLDPATGEIDRGQLIIARLSDGKGNTFRPRGLAADASGRVFVSGVSAARLSGRDLNLINGQFVGEYAGGDPSVLVLAPDFGERLRWTTFVEDGGAGNLVSVDVLDGKVVGGATSDKGTLFTTEGQQGPLDPDVETLDDAWFATWRE